MRISLQFLRRKIPWIKKTTDYSMSCLVYLKFLKLMQKQINGYIKNFSSHYLRGYRKGFSTRLALLSWTEKWKKILDNKGFGGAVLMELSKAFDTINHDLLIAKVHAYDFDRSGLKLLFSYLNNKWHRTKINQKFS